MTSEDLKKLAGTDSRLRAIADGAWWWGENADAWRCEIEGVQWKLDATTLDRSEGCLDLVCDVEDLQQAAQVARAMDVAVVSFNLRMSHPARDELPNIPVVFRVPWCACYKSGDVMGYDAASGRYTCPHCGAKAMSGAEARVEMIALRADLAAKDAQLLVAADVLAEEGRVNEALRCRNAMAPGAAEAHAQREKDRKDTLAQVSASLKAKDAEIKRLSQELGEATTLAEERLAARNAEVAENEALRAELAECGVTGFER